MEKKIKFVEGPRKGDEVADGEDPGNLDFFEGNYSVATVYGLDSIPKDSRKPSLGTRSTVGSVEEISFSPRARISI